MFKSFKITVKTLELQTTQTFPIIYFCSETKFTMHFSETNQTKTFKSIQGVS